VQPLGESSLFGERSCLRFDLAIEKRTRHADFPVTKPNSDIIAELRDLEASELPITAVIRNQRFHGLSKIPALGHASGSLAIPHNASLKPCPRLDGGILPYHAVLQNRTLPHPCSRPDRAGPLESR